MIQHVEDTEPASPSKLFLGTKIFKKALFLPAMLPLFFYVLRVKMCDLGLEGEKKVQDQIPWCKSVSEKLNKNPFLQIKIAAFLLPFKHLNALFTWCLSFQVKVTEVL